MIEWRIIPNKTRKSRQKNKKILKQTSKKCETK